MTDLIDPSSTFDSITTPNFDHIGREETPREITEHRAWLKSIKKEKPLPQHPFKVAVYIRYFNQTKHKNYLEYHKKQFLETISLCPTWQFVDFYIDEGQNAPNMENAPSWSALLQDCYQGKVDLIITQKASNISRKISELSFCARLLATLPSPVGIYFISEDIFTMASYYQEDLADPFFLPHADWVLLPSDAPEKGALHD